MLAGDRCTRCQIGSFGTSFFNPAKFDRCQYCRYQRGSIPCTNCGQRYMEWVIERGQGEIRKCSRCGYVDPAISDSTPGNPGSIPGFPGVLGMLGEKGAKWWISIVALKIAFLMALLLISLLQAAHTGWRCNPTLEKWTPYKFGTPQHQEEHR